jgi:hypothetical protein
VSAIWFAIWEGIHVSAANKRCRLTSRQQLPPLSTNFAAPNCLLRTSPLDSKDARSGGIGAVSAAPLGDQVWTRVEKARISGST